MLWVCRLPWIELGLNEEHYARFYSAVTGKEATLRDLLGLSNEVYTLTRLINARLGMSRKDDTMPWKVFNNPIRSGPTAGKVIDRRHFEQLLDLYYKKRGWDANGIPPAGAEAAFPAT
jgi:aldehyde:ferredoxin oxidoreductase